jgi:hypothetical protein
MNASFKSTPLKLAQNWRPKASSPPLRPPKAAALECASKLAWQNWRKSGVKVA